MALPAETIEQRRFIVAQGHFAFGSGCKLESGHALAIQVHTAFGIQLAGNAPQHVERTIGLGCRERILQAGIGDQAGLGGGGEFGNEAPHVIYGYAALLAQGIQGKALQVVGVFFQPLHVFIDEGLVVQLIFDDDLQQGASKRSITARQDGNPPIGNLAHAAFAGIDDDHLRTAFLGGLDTGQHDLRAVVGCAVLAPNDHQVAILYIRNHLTHTQAQHGLGSHGARRQVANGTAAGIVRGSQTIEGRLGSNTVCHDGHAQDAAAVVRRKRARTVLFGSVLDQLSGIVQGFIPACLAELALAAFARADKGMLDALIPIQDLRRDRTARTQTSQRRVLIDTHALQATVLDIGDNMAATLANTANVLFFHSRQLQKTQCRPNRTQRRTGAHRLSEME